MKAFVAYADRRGVISFAEGLFEPDGTLPIALHEDLEQLKDMVGVVARHAYDGATLLVPGVPEQPDDDWAALSALTAWRDWAWPGVPTYGGAKVLGPDLLRRGI